MNRKTRIRWNAEERNSVVVRASELLNTGASYTKYSLFQDAQSVLVESRRRRGFGNNEIKAMMAEARTLAASSIKSMINEAEVAVEKNRVLPEPKPQVRDIDVIYTLFEALVDRVADSVVRKLVAHLPPEKSAPTGGLLPEYDKAMAKKNLVERYATAESPAERKPRIGVLILGMQPHQGNLLKAEFPDLDITCYDSDEARTKQVLLRAHTIGMTRFISHQVEDRYKKCPRYHRHPAGVAELKTLLTNIQRGRI